MPVPSLPSQTAIPPNAINAKFPDWAQSLWGPERFHVVHGGRGGGRSYNFAQALLLQGMEKPTNNLCVREFQTSISESVHAQLEAIVNDLNLQKFYDVQKRAIYGRNGTQFKYAGIATNPENIKSATNVNNCWVEEAEGVADRSWEFLIPSIRATGSRIFVSFNPGLITAPTYQRFVVHPPKNSNVRRINYLDNPFLTQELRDAAEEMRINDYARYRHVWLGEPLASLVGAIYETEIANIEADGRFLPLHPNSSTKTYVCADLGYADSTVLWFIQKIGYEFFVVGYYENNQQKWDHYLKYISDRPYNIEAVFLPHDSKKNTVENTGLTLFEQTIAAGFEAVRVPSLSVNEGIDATKQFLSRAYFNSTTTEPGVECLRRYVWEATQMGDIKRTPKHDATSHAADALRYGAICLLDAAGDYGEGPSSGKIVKRIRDMTPS